MSNSSKDPQISRKTLSSASGQADAEDARELQSAAVHDASSERELQYLVTLRRHASLGMFGAGPEQGQPDLGQIHAALQTMRNVSVVRRIRSTRLALMGNGPASGSHDILVIRTKPNQSNALANLAHPGLIVERDHLLGHLGATIPHLSPAVGLRPLNTSPGSSNVSFQVLDTKSTPLEKCQVVLYTSGGQEAQGTTADDGTVTITVPVGYINEIAAIYIKPFADCWEYFALRPTLSLEKPNGFNLKLLSEYPAAGFGSLGAESEGFAGWGQRMMGLSQVGRAQLAGRSIKIAIVDSGCDNNHPALTHVRVGLDYTNLDADHVPNSSSWTTDTMSHGTHCAGVITGNGQNGHIRGFVPEAEVHALKLFPGGAFNNLAAALHYCIDNQIDVVNCSLGGTEPSEAITQLIEDARQAGVAIVVAAGNSSGPVQFPGNVPGVLCVAAVGEERTYPDDTYHAHTCAPGTANLDGVFPAVFSCRGSEVGVCAPGVAIISSVPGGGYAAWDGTSMATPAITGLVGMVLAHHPEFAAGGGLRGAQRVDRAFQIVAGAAARLPFSAQQSGAGLPNVGNVSWRTGGSTVPAPIMVGSPLNQTQLNQLEALIRDAFMNQLYGFGQGGQPPAP